MKQLLRIATRKSPLALWQAEHVAQQLTRHYPELVIEFVKLTTQGDVFLEKPLIDIGGKGLFLKELEEAMLDNRADIAVHSMKDVPAQLPKGLILSTILRREDPRDAFVSLKVPSVSQLNTGAVVGTASLRRGCQLKTLRPDLIIKPIRGNVGTRLQKLESGEVDAIILAAAGLKRLGLSQVVKSYLSIEESLPAVGQGAVGIECREQDIATLSLLQPLQDDDTTWCVQAERSMNYVLGGSCHVPIAGHAVLQGDHLHLKGLVLSSDALQRVTAEVRGDKHHAIKLGEQLGHELLRLGARAIMDA